MPAQSEIENNKDAVSDITPTMSECVPWGSSTCQNLLILGGEPAQDRIRMVAQALYRRPHKPWPGWLASPSPVMNEYISTQSVTQILNEAVCCVIELTNLSQLFLRLLVQHLILLGHFSSGGWHTESHCGKVASEDRRCRQHRVTFTGVANNTATRTGNKWLAARLRRWLRVDLSEEKPNS